MSILKFNCPWTADPVVISKFGGIPPIKHPILSIWRIFGEPNAIRSNKLSWLGLNMTQYQKIKPPKESNDGKKKR